MGAQGYIHAEKDGKHYAILAEVQGEPMSAYSKMPSAEHLMDGYLQPAVYPEFGEENVVKVAYRRNGEATVYLAAMEGFDDLQPDCGSDLVTITRCEDVRSWGKPVFLLTFRNPAGGEAMVNVKSNHTNLLFCFQETE